MHRRFGSSLPALAASMTSVFRPLARVAPVVATAVFAASLVQCEQVLGLDDFKNCPQDPGCPSGTGGSGPAPTCTDGKKNGGESDLDCGGPDCTKCDDGKGCENGADCASKVCSGGTCLAPACDDKVQNGDETDTDCGGATCAKCDAGRGCAGDADCEGGLCGADGTCAATCTDGAKNGDESDVDCGGASCPKCAIDAGCATGPDCETGVCQASKCVSYYQWAKAFGNESVQAPSGLANDSAGNVLITGGMQGTLSFDGGSTGLTSAGGNDVFVAKLDKDGTHQWSKRFGDNRDQQAFSVLTDSSQNIIIAGTFSGTINFGGSSFDAGVGAPPLNFLKTAMFLAKLDANGGHKWSAAFNGSVSIDSFKLTSRSLVSKKGVLTDGPIILAGGFYTSSTTIGNTTLTSLGLQDVFIASFASNGTPQWSQSFGDAASQYATSVDTDGFTGDIVVGGHLSGSMQIGATTLSSTSPNGDIFVAKLNAQGVPQWSKVFAVNDPTQLGTTVALAGSGNIYLAGYQTSGTDFGGGPTTGGLYLAALDANGEHLWSKAFVGEAPSAFAHPIELTTIPMGGLAMSGSFSDSLDLGGGPLEGGFGSSSLFVARFDDTGAHVWSHNFGIGISPPTPHVPTGLKAISPNDVYVSGFFKGSVDFGGGALPSLGRDVFVAKLFLP